MDIKGLDYGQTTDRAGYVYLRGPVCRPLTDATRKGKPFSAESSRKIAGRRNQGQRPGRLPVGDRQQCSTAQSVSNPCGSVRVKKCQFPVTSEIILVFRQNSIDVLKEYPHTAPVASSGGDKRYILKTSHDP